MMQTTLSPHRLRGETHHPRAVAGSASDQDWRLADPDAAPGHVCGGETHHPRAVAGSASDQDWRLADPDSAPKNVCGGETNQNGAT